jgi:hypothetical protein
MCVFCYNKVHKYPTNIKEEIMKATWIIQTDMGQGSDIQNYVKAVKDSGANVIEVSYVPFSGELPSVNASGPVILHGAVEFIKKCYEKGQWLDGIFGDPDTFTYQSWSENYGSMLLNSPDATELMSLGEFTQKYSQYTPKQDLFIRPQHDTKSIVGRVWSAKEFYDWALDVQKGGYVGIDKNTPIVVGTPYGIEAEWRLFIVDNEIVSASQYHKKGRLFKQPGAPEDVLAFAKKVIEKHTPAKAYTLDICHSAGNCYIVEAQGFNSAGHYACDMQKVALAINEMVIKEWKNTNKTSEKYKR